MEPWHDRGCHISLVRHVEMNPSKNLSQQNKIVSLESLAKGMATQRTNGKTVAMCHGVFDLLHIGHIKHLEEAASLADLLVVSITPDRFVNKGPGRPRFSEHLRLEAIAALQCVDFVSLNQWPTAEPTIELIKPDIYVKGPDYQDPTLDLTGGISREYQAVQRIGGQLVTTGGLSFSSSSLINDYFSDLPEATRSYLKNLRSRFSIDDVLSRINACSNVRTLIVGEVIIDEYQYCTAIGKSSKEPTLAVRLESTDAFPGGALAAANHAAQFSAEVGLVSVAGNDFSKMDVDGWLNPAVARHLVTSTAAPNMTKRRIVDRYFFHKLLEIYENDDVTFHSSKSQQLATLLAANAAKYDLVVALDFGHGLFTQEVIDVLMQESRFLALNVQSNAGNLGFNTLSKYKRADYVSVTENELRLDVRDRHSALRDLMTAAADRLHCSSLAITRGRAGCAMVDSERKLIESPALVTRVVDRIGAGDAFLVATAMCAAQGAPAEITAFIGNVVGAQATRIVGNSRSVEKLAVIRHAQALLK